MTLTATQLETLPVHSAVRCTTDRGRTFLALKIDQGTGRHNPSRWNTTDGPATTTNVAAHNPQRLELATDTAEDEPSDEVLGRLLDAVDAYRAAMFATPADFEEHLEVLLEDASLTSILIRDDYDRPWIVTWDEGGDAFVISYPEESDDGAMPEPATYHGPITLPTYPVRRVIEETL